MACIKTLSRAGEIWTQRILKLLTQLLKSYHLYKLKMNQQDGLMMFEGRQLGFSTGLTKAKKWYEFRMGIELKWIFVTSILFL